MKSKIKILSAFAVLFSLVFLSGCTKSTPVRYDLNLEVWGLFDDRDAFSEIFENYKRINKNIKTIEYRKLTVDTYRRDLIEALASGQGPDIFILHNTWAPSFKDKLAPSPKEVLTQKQVEAEMVDVVKQDFVKEGEVYALPLSVDSLALFYNKDIFNNAGLALPPSNWDAFLEYVRQLTIIDESGNILQSGTALGTAENINRPTDILNLMMMQLGNPMTDGTRATFSGKTGEDALRFYTQFSNASNPNYSWNPRMHYSLDAFSEGRLAMMLNYSWQIETLKRKSPKLNFAIAPAPQLDGGKNKVNYANYWAYGVAVNKAEKTPTQALPEGYIKVTNEMRVAESWKLLKYMTMKPSGTLEIEKDSTQIAGSVANPLFDPADSYTTKTKKPSARRDLIVKQQEDLELGVFANQNLFAKSWYQKNPDAVESIMAGMITKVNLGQQSIQDAINLAEAQINQAQ